MSQRSITSFFTRLSGDENISPPGKKNDWQTKKTVKNVPKEKKRVSSSPAEIKKRKSTPSKSLKNEAEEGTQKKKRKKIIEASDSSEDEASNVKTEDLSSISKEETKLESPEKVKVETAEVIPKSKKIKKDDYDKSKQKLKEETGSSKSKKADDKKSKTADDKESKKVENAQKTAEINKEDVDESPKSPEAEKVDEVKKSPSKAQNAFKDFFASKSNPGNATSKKYDPTLLKYDPIKDASWKHGEKVPYYALSRTLEEIESVSARLKIIEILSNFFRSVIVLTPDDLLPSVYLCLNHLAPAYEGIELGIAETNLMKAIAHSTGRTMAQIKVDALNAGDLGIVAEQSKSKQRMIFQPQPLILRNVFAKLKEIAKMSGNSSQLKKVEKIQSMFVACRDSEARFLIRSLAGKLRIGLAEQSVLQALALACTKTPPNQEYPPEILNASKGHSAETFKSLVDGQALILKTTYCECPNYELIMPVILKDGIEKLPEHCKLTPGIPLKPMLAHPTKGVQEVLHRFDGLKFTCEWKYDGERAQIHISEDDTVSIYSRNQENNTSKYPDVINRLSNCRSPEVRSCVLDCEAVAWDREKQQIMPFQILSTRKRKDANEADIKVQVCIFMFDLLYLNGEPLVKKPFAERRRLLKEYFKEFEGEWCFATSLDVQTMEEVQEFLEESVKGNCEGLMVKTLEEDATYEIAKRSRNWLKLKKDYLEGVGDTLDVVVIGGYMGKGKRTGTYGGFLLACYDPDNEEYQTICKIGTGFSDEALQTHTDFLKEHKIPEAKSYYRYNSSLEPDHWFDAVQVWEIKCADLSLSPVHCAGAGIVDKERGVSLRFPRFIRIRDDKTVEDATSAQQVADMYSSQDQIKNATGSGGGKNAEEEFY